jgi:ParB-like chromosome segregation protein Spo0J
VNPRSRGRSKFRQITSNISKLGLKRPITVARREARDGEARYDLVCGQGRLEAYRALGQPEVPAIVIDADKEDLLLMSLAENLARRRNVGLELVKEVRAMKERGHDYAEIARMAATPQDQLVEPDKPKQVRGLRAEDMARMEKEMDSLSEDFRLVEETHGRNVLNLVLACGYLRKLLGNAGIARYLSQHYPEILAEFNKLLASTALEG